MSKLACKDNIGTVLWRLDRHDINSVLMAPRAAAADRSKPASASGSVPVRVEVRVVLPEARFARPGRRQEFHAVLLGVPTDDLLSGAALS